MPQTNAPNVTVVLNVDEKAFQDQMVRASATMANAFRGALRRVESDFDKTARNVASQLAATFVGTAGTAGTAGKAAGRNYAAQFSTNFDLDPLKAQLEGLTKSAQARGNVLKNLGLDPKLFAGVEAGLKDATQQFENYKKAAAKGLSVEEALRYQKGIESVFENVRAELRETEEVGRSFRTVQDAQRSANVAQSQQETTRIAADTKAQTQIQIQQSQRAARVRIELARFTFRQIQFFERQLANAVRGTFSILGNLATSATSSVRRLASVFRRSNSELNDGLRGALRQRESSLSRSFRRQTSAVGTQVGRQSAILDRFDRRASTGIAGAVTGRSRLGALVGGGAAIGGGFALVRGLRQGFQEAVDLNEALNAVTAIFGEATQSVVEFSENSIEALFLTQAEALKAAQSFGVFGKSAGLVDQELADFSNELTLIAADLASFYNTTVPEAVTSISAALRGESEPIRRFGVLLNEQILRQTAVREGIIETDRQLVPSERVLAAYAEVLRQASVAQGDAARTADDFANSSRRARAAVVTTFSLIAKAAIPVAEVLLRGVLPALDALNKFIEGDVNPALQTLRAGLIGAAAALGALLAARGAIEIIQFLGVALRGVATPLGLVIAAVAGLGAAINIFRNSSQDAAVLFFRIREALTSGVLTGLQFAGDLFLRIANFVRTQVIPVFIGLVTLLVSQIGPAFRFVANIVEQRVLPVFRTIGGFLVTGLTAAIPVIAAVIGQLVRLGQAIGSAFTGDFGGLADIGSSILSGLQGIGQSILDFLVPQIQRGVAAIVGVFNSIDWAGLGLQALEFINTVGRILGSIVSDPRFITALAAVAAAGAVVVGSFVAGVAQGIADNRQELIRLFGDALSLALTEGVKAAISNPSLVLGLIAAGTFAAFIVSAFNAVGQRGGGSFAKGLGRGFIQGQSKLRALALANPFTSTTATQRFRDASAAQSAAYLKGFERIERNLRRIGGKATTAFPSSGSLSEQASAVRRLEGEFKRTGNTLGEANTKALLLRSTLRGLFRPQDAAQFRQTLGDAFRRVNYGQLGRNAAVGFMFGYTAVVSGKQGGTAGILGVTTSALAAGLSTGSPWVAAGVAAAGLVAFAFRDTDSAIDQARESVDDFAEALRGLGAEGDQIDLVFGEVIGSINETLGQEVANKLLTFLPAGFVDAASAQIVAGTFDQDNAFNDLLDTLKLTGDQYEILSTLGADAALAGDISSIRLGERKGAVAAVQALNAQLAEQDVQIENVAVGLGILDQANQNYQGSVEALRLEQRQLQQEEDLAFRADPRNRILLLDQELGFKRELTQAEKDLQAAEAQRLLNINTQDLFNQYAEPLQAVKGIGGDLERIFEAIVAAAKKAGKEIDLGFLRSLLGLEEAARKTNSELRFLELNTDFNVIKLKEAVPATEEFKEALNDAGDAMRDLANDSSLAQVAINSLNTARTDALSAQVDTLNIKLDTARELIDEAREAFTDFITGDYQNSAQEALDDFLLGLPSLAEQLAEADKRGGVLGAAERRSIFGDFRGGLAEIAQLALEEGMSGADFAKLLAPLGPALSEITNPLSAFFDPDNIIVPKDITDLLTGVGQIDPGQFDVAAGLIFDREAQFDSIQNELDKVQAELDTEVIFSEDQIREELRRLGLSGFQLEVALTPNTDLLQGDPAVQAIAKFAADFTLIQAALISANEQRPEGTPPITIESIYQSFVLPGGNPEDFIDGAADGIAKGSEAAGGGTPSRSVTYQPTPIYVPNPFAVSNAGSNVG